ncbi:hypothetical protein [Lachnoclostridium phytofermentans]|uniref:Uncharacterized protein n=1 Tax=Lachnoclostridium phytofermentans (strain ATCC 700394 / DSM 18823 / ISDg) TaxID=357809 RepID=A9KM23_LACP7|nr:hypothetical protein [Lachnoclostridium phytofermentans]ABX41366.1 hypothetical protein Cphy_0986 [Lachnoclostridium phytofermentans ISDg]
MEIKKTTSSKDCGTKDGINFDYDYNTEYGDGDIPNPDKNSTKNSTENSRNSSRNSSKNCSNNYKDVIPDEVPRRDGPGGE